MARKDCADKASTEVRRGRDWDATAEKFIQISHQMGVSIDDLMFHLCFSGYALVDMKPVRELWLKKRLGAVGKQPSKRGATQRVYMYVAAQREKSEHFLCRDL